jgi:hypothetical protein
MGSATQRHPGETEAANSYILTSDGEALAYFDSFDEARSIAEGMGKAGAIVGIEHHAEGGTAKRTWAYEPRSMKWVERP